MTTTTTTDEKPTQGVVVVNESSKSEKEATGEVQKPVKKGRDEFDYSDNQRGFIVVFGGIFLHLTLGSFYTFGNMLPYIASYQAYKNGASKEQYSYYSTQGIWIFALLSTAMPLAMSIGSKTELSIGPAYTCLIGCYVMSAGVALTYFVIDSLWLTILTYGIITGAGIGFAYATPLVCGMRWFPKNKGLVTGSIVLGFGASSVIFNIVQQILINPNDVALDAEVGFLESKEVLDMIPVCFLKLAGIYVVMQTIGSLLLTNPVWFDPSFIKKGKKVDKLLREDQVSYDSLESHSIQSEMAQVGVATQPLADGDATEKLIDEGSAAALRKKRHRRDRSLIGDFSESVAANISSLHLRTLNIAELLASARFWNLFMTLFMMCLVMVYLTSQWKEFSNKHLGLTSDATLAYLGSVSSIFNGLGRLAWAAFLDFTDSYYLTFGTMTLLNGCLMIVWPLIVRLEHAWTIVLDFVILSGLFFSLTGTFSVLPTHVTNIYGNRNNGIVYGLIFIAQIPAALIGSFAIVEMRENLGWNVMSWAISGCSFASFILVMTFK